MSCVVFMFRLEKIKIRSLRSIAKILGTTISFSGAFAMALLKGPKLLNSSKSLLCQRRFVWKIKIIIKWTSSFGLCWRRGKTKNFSFTSAQCPKPHKSITAIIICKRIFYLCFFIVFWLQCWILWFKELVHLQISLLIRA